MPVPTIDPSTIRLLNTSITGLTSSINGLIKIQNKSMPSSKMTENAEKIDKEYRDKKHKDEYAAYLKSLNEKYKLERKLWQYKWTKPFIKTWTWFLNTKLFASFRDGWNRLTGVIGKHFHDVLGELGDVFELGKSLFKFGWGIFKDIGSIIKKIAISPFKMMFSIGRKQLQEEKEQTGWLKRIFGVLSGGGKYTGKKKEPKQDEKEQTNILKRVLGMLFGQKRLDELQFLKEKKLKEMEEKRGLSKLTPFSKAWRKQFKESWIDVKKGWGSAKQSVSNVVSSKFSGKKDDTGKGGIDFTELASGLITLIPLLIPLIPMIVKSIIGAGALSTLYKIMSSDSDFFGFLKEILGKAWNITGDVTKNIVEFTNEKIRKVKKDEKGKYSGIKALESYGDTFTEISGAGIGAGAALKANKYADILKSTKMGMSGFGGGEVEKPGLIGKIKGLNWSGLIDSEKVSPISTTSKASNVLKWLTEKNEAIGKIKGVGFLWRKLGLFSDVMEGVNETMKTGSLLRGLVIGGAHTVGRIGGGAIGGAIGGTAGSAVLPGIGTAAGTIAGGATGAHYGVKWLTDFFREILDTKEEKEKAPIDSSSYYEKVNQAENSGKKEGNLYGFKQFAWNEFKPSGAPSSVLLATEEQQRQAIEKYTKKSISLLTANGFAVTPWTLYACHHFGHTVGINVLKNETAKVSDTLSTTAMTKNPYISENRLETNADLKRFWINRGFNDTSISVNEEVDTTPLTYYNSPMGDAISDVPQLSGLSSPFKERVANAFDAFRSRYGRFPIIASARRTTEEQTKLYNDYISGRTRTKAAPPGKSYHEYGQAIDIHKHDINAVKPFMESAGLSLPMPGIEPWHWQLKGLRNFADLQRAGLATSATSYASSSPVSSPLTSIDDFYTPIMTAFTKGMSTMLSRNLGIVGDPMFGIPFDISKSSEKIKSSMIGMLPVIKNVMKNAVEEKKSEIDSAMKSIGEINFGKELTGIGKNIESSAKSAIGERPEMKSIKNMTGKKGLFDSIVDTAKGMIPSGFTDKITGAFSSFNPIDLKGGMESMVGKNLFNLDEASKNLDIAEVNAIKPKEKELEKTKPGFNISSISEGGSSNTNISNAGTSPQSPIPTLSDLITSGMGYIGSAMGLASA